MLKTYWKHWSHLVTISCQYLVYHPRSSIYQHLPDMARASCSCHPSSTFAKSLGSWRPRRAGCTVHAGPGKPHKPLDAFGLWYLFPALGSSMLQKVPKIQGKPLSIPWKAHLKKNIMLPVTQLFLGPWPWGFWSLYKIPGYRTTAPWKWPRSWTQLKPYLAKAHNNPKQWQWHLSSSSSRSRLRVFPCVFPWFFPHVLFMFPILSTCFGDL